MTKDNKVDGERKYGLGYRILFKLASAFGIGWQVMLWIVRIVCYLLAPVVGLIVGFAVMIMFPEAHGLLIAAAFVLPPLLTIGVTEFFLWMYQSPVDALTY